jgi:hypothetical protein
MLEQKIQGPHAKQHRHANQIFWTKPRYTWSAVGTCNHLVLTTGYLSVQMSSGQDKVVMCSNKRHLSDFELTPMCPKASRHVKPHAALRQAFMNSPHRREAFKDPDLHLDP